MKIKIKGGNYFRKDSSKSLLIKRFIILCTCILSIFLFVTLASGCAQRGTVEPDYSAQIAEKVLIAINNNDYDSISSYFNSEFKESLKKLVDPKTTKAYTTEKDAFINEVCKKLIDKIGQYQQGTLKFSRTLTEKGYTSVFYTCKYSKEAKGNVSVQFVFKNENGKMLLAGLWFESATLKQ